MTEHTSRGLSDAPSGHQENQAMHTPGPWAVQEDDEFDGCKFIPVETDAPTGPNCRGICEVHPCYTDRGGAISKTDRANARLIAAAPDLLEAANEAFEFLGGVDGAAEVRGKLLAAIIKARTHV